MENGNHAGPQNPVDSQVRLSECRWYGFYHAESSCMWVEFTDEETATRQAEQGVSVAGPYDTDAEARAELDRDEQSSKQ